jgi:hypothetical protein
VIHGVQKVRADVQDPHALLIYEMPVALTLDTSGEPPNKETCEMEVLIVNFELQGMTEAEFYRQCDEIAPAFAAVPGLASKIWLADVSTNTFGGVYVFVDGDARDAFLASDLFREVGATPGLANFVVRPFGTLAGPTRVTRGAAVVAA